MTHPENEHEGGWNPEQERVPEELQREYLKFIKNANATHERDVKRKAEEVREVVGFIPVKQPTYDEVVVMCRRAWTDTASKIPFYAPNEVKHMTFLTLLNKLVSDFSTHGLPS